MSTKLPDEYRVVIDDKIQDKAYATKAEAVHVADRQIENGYRMFVVRVCYRAGQGKKDGKIEASTRIVAKWDSGTRLM